MTRAQSLKARLASDSAITALIGTGDLIRLYPMKAEPPKSLTTLTYKFDADYAHVLSGVAEVTAGLELNCWSANYETAHSLADAIFARIEGYRSAVSGPFGGVGGINVLHCLAGHDEDIYVSITPDEGMFNAFVSYEFKYTLP